jgi:hypothetical protein
LPKAEEDKNKPVKEKPPPPVYQPFKCGLCEFAHETIDGIKEHCWLVRSTYMQCDQK